VTYPADYNLGSTVATCPYCGWNYIQGSWHQCQVGNISDQVAPNISYYVVQCSICGLAHQNAPCSKFQELIDLLKEVLEKIT
jgi:transcription elongation factor Elf1